MIRCRPILCLSIKSSFFCGSRSCWNDIIFRGRGCWRPVTCFMAENMMPLSTVEKEFFHVYLCNTVFCLLCGCMCYTEHSYILSFIQSALFRRVFLKAVPVLWNSLFWQVLRVITLEAIIVITFWAYCPALAYCIVLIWDICNKHFVLNAAHTASSENVALLLFLKSWEAANKHASSEHTVFHKPIS